MTEIQEILISTLRKAADRLREMDLPGELAVEMEKLARQVDEPCVVAVVGEARVGKSMIVNALLGGDFARVGILKTTATINYFSYGQPPNPDRPIRCRWRDGTATWEGRALLDGLRGSDLETMRRAGEVEHLEYFVEHPFLEGITLVDTPDFQNSILIDPFPSEPPEFTSLYCQLRERRNYDVRRIVWEADAVICLFDASVERTDQTLPYKFRAVTLGRFSAVNAVGAISRVDLHPKVLARRRELSEEFARTLNDELHIVVPVAAGLRRALDGLLAEDRAGLQRLLKGLRRIPPEMLELLVKTDRRFLEREFEDCPVSAVERREIFEELPEDARQWPVFLSMARVATDLDFDIDLVEARLEDTSNFEALEEVLNSRFVERGHILRCLRIVGDAREVMREIQYAHLPQYRKDRHPNLAEIEKLYAELSEEFDGFYHQLMQYNADFEALQKLEEADHGFSEAEWKELRFLLGMYGTEVKERLLPGKEDGDYVLERMVHWKNSMEQAPVDSAHRAVAERAYIRYRMIYPEMVERSEPTAPNEGVE